MRTASLLLVSVACACLCGCGSGGPKYAGTWSQKGSRLNASWTVPSAASIDLQLTGASSASSCTATLGGRSEHATILIVESDPAAYFKIGTALKPGSKARTTCEVSGIVKAVSFGVSRLKHSKAP